MAMTTGERYRKETITTATATATITTTTIDDDNDDGASVVAHQVCMHPISEG